MSITAPVVLIDCGGNCAECAALVLAEHLSAADWDSLSELVVTHFDADHWVGLQVIAQSAPHGPGGRSELPIYFPAVPFNVDRRLSAVVARFISVTSPSGVEAMDLRAAWGRLIPVRLNPLAKGDPFLLAGRLHEVLWPPQHFDGSSTERLNLLVQRIEAEADSLHDEGYPQLKWSLREAYQNGPHDGHQGDAIMIDAGLEAPNPSVRRKGTSLRTPRRILVEVLIGLLLASGHCAPVRQHSRRSDMIGGWPRHWRRSPCTLISRSSAQDASTLPAPPGAYPGGGCWSSCRQRSGPWRSP